MTREKIFLVLPAYNEAAVIGEVVSAVQARYPRVIVVDDGSTDGTGDRALQAGAAVLRHPLNRGQGAALQTGIEYALSCGAECIVTFDSDGQHRVGDVARLVEPIAGGKVEICLGSRFLSSETEIPAGRRWLLRAGVLFTRLVSGLQLSDAHNGLRAFSRRAAEQIDLRQDRMAHASELVDQIVRMGLPFREVPVAVLYTEYSTGKGQTGSSAFRIVLDYLMGRLLG